jgi:ATP-dependent helicase HrpA
VVIPLRCATGHCIRQEETESDLSIQEGVLQTLEEIAAEERSVKALPGDVLVFLVGEREIRGNGALAQKSPATPTPKSCRCMPASGRRIKTGYFRRMPAGGSFSRPMWRKPRSLCQASVTSSIPAKFVSAVTPIVPKCSACRWNPFRKPAPISAKDVVAGYPQGFAIGFTVKKIFTACGIYRSGNTANQSGGGHSAMLVLKLGDIEQFPFMQPPERGYINDGYKLLEELGAVTEDKKVTVVGRQLARFSG